MNMQKVLYQKFFDVDKKGNLIPKNRRVFLNTRKEVKLVDRTWKCNCNMMEALMQLELILICLMLILLVLAHMVLKNH